MDDAANNNPSNKSRHRRQQQQQQQQPPASSSSSSQMISPPALDLASPGLTVLALRLTQTLTKTNAASGSNPNLVFSPLSIYAALALAARGATLRELLAVLGARSRDDLAGTVRALAAHALSDRSPTGGLRVTFVSAVWHDESRQLSPAFRAAAAAMSLKAETRAADFRQKPGEAVERINAWAAESTNNLIDSILSDGQVSADTDVILANAIHFKAVWQVPFDEEDTEEGTFHRLEGRAIDGVPFMQDGRRHYVACHDGFKVLKLPYKKGFHFQQRQPGAAYSMCVFLPDERAGLGGLLDRIGSGGPGFLKANLPTSLVPVGELRLPRFVLTFTDDMSDVLRELGVEAPFDGKDVDLSDMLDDDRRGSGSGRRPLVLQGVFHRAVIEVNEEGTEAAAVTRLMLRGASMPMSPPPVPVDFVADHPFAFFVVEEVSGAVVFAGSVLEPSPSVPGDRRRRRRQRRRDHDGGDGEHVADLDRIGHRGTREARFKPSLGWQPAPLSNYPASPPRHYFRRFMLICAFMYIAYIFWK